MSNSREPSAGEPGSTVYDEDGEFISAKDSEFYSTTMWNIIEDAFDYSNQHGLPDACASAAT